MFAPERNAGLASRSEECLAVSAGGAGSNFAFSPTIKSLLNRLGMNKYPIPESRSKFVSRFEGMPAFAVRARKEGNERALGVVGEASMELFDTAWQDGFRRILMQILASGSKDVPKSDRPRPFSAMFSLVESVRAFGEWCRIHPSRKLEVAIYVLDRPVYLEITGGRLDLYELLSSCDLRFWAEVIYPDDKTRRQMCQAGGDATVRDLADWLGLDLNHWQVKSIPRIGSAKDPQEVPLAKILDEKLQGHVIPGGTLSFMTLQRRFVDSPERGGDNHRTVPGSLI
jgi:hypothetical protein